MIDMHRRVIFAGENLMEYICRHAIFEGESFMESNNINLKFHLFQC